MRRRPGEKGNAEANHSQLWHKLQVSCVAPGKQQCQGLLGKALGFFLVCAYKAAEPSGQVPAHHAGRRKKNPDSFVEATTVWHWFY